MTDSELKESPFKGKRGMARLIQAAFNSINGLRLAWRHESAFRQESLMAAVLIPAACWLDVAPIERALMIGSVLLVLVVELLNSSVEAAIDRISLERHSLSGRAKDLGSAAVLLALALMSAVWLIVLLA